MRNCVKGPGKYGRSQSDMFGVISVENKSVFGCPEVQERCDSAKGEVGLHREEGWDSQAEIGG